MSRSRSSWAAAAALLAVACSEERVLEAPPAPPLAPAIFVVNSLGETLSRILLEDGSVVADALALGSAPNDIVMSEDGELAYVVSSGSNRVDIVELEPLQVAGSIDLGPGSNPYAIALVPGGAAAYVSNFASGDVTRLDLAARRVVGRFPVGRGPEGLLVAGDRLFVAVTGYHGGDFGPGEVAVVAIPADTVRARLAVGTNPQALERAPDGTIHVLCTGDYGAAEGRVFVIEPSAPAVVDSLDLGGAPAALLILDDGAGLAAGFYGGLRRYDRASRLVTASGALAAEAGLSALVLDSTAYRLYVSDFDDSAVRVLDLVTDSLIASYAVGHGPVSLAVRR